MRVWIDWNGDGDFTDAGELVVAPAAPTIAKIKRWICVPPTAKPGKTRMRVAVRQDAPPLSCGNFKFGEVEDYTINITSARLEEPDTNKADWEMEEEPGIEFSIYPNPVMDKMIIERSGFNESKAANTMAEMTVISANGAIIMQSRLTSLVQTVDVSKFANGIYFVTIKTGISKTTKKVVINH